MPTPRTEITGNAVRDAYTGTDKNGKPFLMVTVGCNDSKKIGENDYETLRSLFVSVRLFGADTTMHVPSKGDRVNAYGRLYEEHTEGKNGEKYKNNVMDAEYVRAWPKRSAPGWGDQAQDRQPSQGGFGGPVDEEPPF